MPPHSQVEPVAAPVVPQDTPLKNQFPSITDIKSRLPKDCFEAELHTSLYYVARSAFLIFGLLWAVHKLCSPESSFYITNEIARGAIWAVYWYIQGILMWGVFVLGHDCGHGSFSKYKLVNHILGNILHSSILVPYESWKTTHRLHHKNTGNIDKDEVFYPYRDDTSINWYKRFVVGGVGFAWMIYLYANVRRHFWVYEDIYERIRLAVAITHLWWVAMAMVVTNWVWTYGWETVSFYYFAPLFFFMSWLVITTFLHHQDEDAPWYGNSEWTYVKGNLSSIDRSYGYIVNNLIHNIGTHQIHHLFPKIPHYKLNRATASFKEAYPDLFRASNEAILPSFFKNYYIYLKYATVENDAQYFTYKEKIIADKKSKTQ